MSDVVQAVDPALGVTMMVEIEHLTGDGWLHFGTVRIAQVSYAIEAVYVSDPIDGTEVHVKLSHHAIHAVCGKTACSHCISLTDASCTAI